MNRYQIAYDYLKSKAPCQVTSLSFPMDVVIMPSGNTYGLEYAETFITLDELLEQEHPQLLFMFAGDIRFLLKDDFFTFFTHYDHTAQYCKTSYKKDFQKKVIQLHDEIEAMDEDEQFIVRI